MPGNSEKYHFLPVGELFARPLRVRVRAAFTNSGATVTVASTRRQSHPGAAITGDTGVYAVTGLPRGVDYHPGAFHMSPGTGTKLVSLANVSTFDASAGTLTFITRQSSDGAPTDPADGTLIYFTLDVDEGLSGS